MRWNGKGIRIMQTSAREIQRTLDTEILLQAFDWNTAVNYQDAWYQFLESCADEICHAGYTAIWLPPPWNDTSQNRVGYFWQDFNKNTAYGKDAELKSLAAAFKKRGIKIVYDIVLNHRNMGVNANDIWSNIPIDEQRANTDYKLLHNFSLFDNGRNDLNLRNKKVLNIFADEMVNLIVNYSAGGFRFDFAKGFDADIPKHLIDKIQKRLIRLGLQMPELFLVSEYWDANQDHLKTWADISKTKVFDFPLHHEMNHGRFSNTAIRRALNTNPESAWRELAVTFVDNHDTGHSEIYSFKKDKYADYAVDIRHLYVEQHLRGHAYAYILLTPGTPCVYWPHWHAWGRYDGMKEHIAELITIRKLVGIHATSDISFHEVNDDSGLLATVIGTKEIITIGIYNEGKTITLDSVVAATEHSNIYYAKNGWGFISCATDSQIVNLLDRLNSFKKTTSIKEAHCIESPEIAYRFNRL